jgi:hypothetical protein
MYIKSSNMQGNILSRIIEDGAVSLFHDALLLNVSPVGRFYDRGLSITEQARFPEIIKNSL